MEAAERLPVRPLLEGKSALGKQLMSMGVGLHFVTRASKDSISFETRVRVFLGPRVTSPSPDSSLNSYSREYPF